MVTLSVLGLISVELEFTSTSPGHDLSERYTDVTRGSSLARNPNRTSSFLEPLC